MKRLAEFSMEDGSVILVEVDEPENGRRTLRRGGPAEVFEKARDTFEVALNKVKPAAEAIITKLRGLTDSPDAVGVEFGVKLSATAGAVIASAATEANFKISLTWKRKEPKGE